MDKLTVTMPMKEYLELKEKAERKPDFFGFMDRMSHLYKTAQLTPMDPGIKYSSFDSLQEACLEARKLLNLPNPPKGIY